MDITCSYDVNATLVANDFLDRYLAEVSGEYLKVYLYVLRHKGEPMSAGQIADGLRYTEADVRRALSYWEKAGALRIRTRSGQETPGGAIWRSGLEGAAAPGGTESGVWSRGTLETAAGAAAPGMARAGGVGTGGYGGMGAGGYGGRTGSPGASCTPAQMDRLQQDGEFSQLLYIAQRYLNRILTQRDLEVLAYLYDNLRMPAELLEYLVEYCVQNGHTSIRYIETVGLSWHEKGFATVEEAQAYAAGFTKDSFSVMRAFGLTDRKPGEAEKEMMERWFHTYGFTRELVLEACNRTMEATHNPSFRYADKILSDWKKAGVRSLKDVSALDEKRRAGQAGQRRQQEAAARPKNQFHNFEQRDTDYNALVMEQVRGWLGEDRKE